MHSDAPRIKRQASILIAGGQEGFGRLASEVIREHLGQTYDLRIGFCRLADEFLMLIQDRLFDLFIVVADDISFSFKAANPSREEREKRVRQFIRHLKSRHGTPVLALLGWGDLDFAGRIVEADFSIRYTRIFEALPQAVQGFIDGAFDSKMVGIHREEEPCTAVLIPEEEGVILSERLTSLQKEFASLPNELERYGSIFPVNPEKYHPNRLFEVFNKLRLKDGCTLDCYCHRIAGFGLPCVYSRKTGAAPIKTFNDFNMQFPHRRDRLRHIEVEPSPSGYFQFAVFSNTVSQFHRLHQHACVLRHPVMTVRQLKRILESIAGAAPRKELVKARIVKPRLAVVTTECFVKVMFVAYEPVRGLYFQHTYIRSNVIEHVSRIKLVDFKKGINRIILS